MILSFSLSQKLTQDSRSTKIGSLLIFFAVIIASTSITPAVAQTCSASGNVNFFNACSGASAPLTYNGNYTMNIGQNESLTINGNVTINGTLTINFTGNTSLLRVLSGVTFRVTNVVVNNSNPAKVMDIDGTFTVTGTLNFQGENIDVDGTGRMNVGTITNAQNVTCSTEGDCPTINTQNGCTPAGQGLCGEGVLPITLFRWDAMPIGASVVLSWSTLMEKNFSHFVVERSQTGVDYEQIATIDGFGNSVVKRDYTFEDRFPLSGRSYYRLVAVDLDGFVEQFSPVSVEYSGKKSVRVYPNPSQGGQTNIQLSFDTGEPVEVVVTDLMGNEKVRFSTTQPETPLTLSSGVYIVKVSAADFSDLVRLVVH